MKPTIVAVLAGLMLTAAPALAVVFSAPHSLDVSGSGATWLGDFTFDAQLPVTGSGIRHAGSSAFDWVISYDAPLTFSFSDSAGRPIVIEFLLSGAARPEAGRVRNLLEVRPTWRSYDGHILNVPSEPFVSSVLADGFFTTVDTTFDLPAIQFRASARGSELNLDPGTLTIPAPASGALIVATALIAPRRRKA